MNAFNRLPGFVQTPAGRERDVLRLLPRVLVFGTLLLALPSLGARIGDLVKHVIAEQEREIAQLQQYIAS